MEVTVMSNSNMNPDELVDFMSGLAIIFSGFAIVMNNLEFRVKAIEEEQSLFKDKYQIEWTTLSIIAKDIGLSKDAVRKQLQNGNYEEGVDFKRDGNKIVVHQGAIGRLHRKRRSNNG